MRTESVNNAAAEKASNLRAIFEILSYIHADALKDDYKELADRIEFALNLAEKLIKGSDNTSAQPLEQPEENAADPDPAPTPIVNVNQ